MRRSLFLCACCLTSMAGCAVEQARNDQDKIRVALLDLYTNQLMDNLIRASNGMPIIHLDYGTAQATVVSKNSAMSSDSYANTVSHVLTVAATTTMTTTRTAMNTFMGSASHDNMETVAVSATPLTTSVEAYNAYLQFLALPGSLQVSSCPPEPGIAHICRRRGPSYYWIPIAFKDQFYNLQLATTADRGRLLVPPPKYYSVSLLDAVPRTGNRVDVRIDREIPNLDGRVLFEDGTAANKPEFRPDTNVRLFRAKWITIYIDPAHPPLGSLTTPSLLKSRLQQGPIAVSIDLPERRPDPPTTDELLDLIPFVPEHGQIAPMAASGS